MFQGVSSMGIVIAVVMLLISFALLLLINSLQTWARKRQGGV